jgi:hypothetical protein
LSGAAAKAGSSESIWHCGSDAAIGKGNSLPASQWMILRVALRRFDVAFFAHHVYLSARKNSENRQKNG